MFKKFLVLSVLLVISASWANSLWTENSRSPFVKRTNFKPGDTITVIIDESLNAAQSGTTKTDKSSDVGIDLSNKADSSSGSGRSSSKSNSSDQGLNFSTNGKQNYSGTGKTTRETTIKTTITATVIDVQPNGSLFVLGQRQIKVNEEVEQLEVSGIVNVEKLSDDNTIYSTQLANAKIVIKGAGVVSSSQQPGMMSKLFGWMF